MNPYSLLDTYCTAGDVEIKAAYRRKAMKYHPDRGGTVEQFNRIKQAFETIKTSSLRLKQRQEMLLQRGACVCTMCRGNGYTSRRTQWSSPSLKTICTGCEGAGISIK